MNKDKIIKDAPKYSYVEKYKPFFMRLLFGNDYQFTKKEKDMRDKAKDKSNVVVNNNKIS